MCGNSCNNSCNSGSDDDGFKLVIIITVILCLYFHGVVYKDTDPPLEKHKLINVIKEAGYKNKYILSLSGGEKVIYTPKNFKSFEKNYLKECKQVYLYISTDKTRRTTSYLRDISYHEGDIEEQRNNYYLFRPKEYALYYFYVACYGKKKKTDKEKGFHIIKNKKPIEKTIFLKKGE